MHLRITFSNKILIADLNQNVFFESRNDTFINCAVEPSPGFVVGESKNL